MEVFKISKKNKYTDKEKQSNFSRKMIRETGKVRALFSQTYLSSSSIS